MAVDAERGSLAKKLRQLDVRMRDSGAQLLESRMKLQQFLPAEPTDADEAGSDEEAGECHGGNCTDRLSRLRWKSNAELATLAAEVDEVSCSSGCDGEPCDSASRLSRRLLNQSSRALDADVRELSLQSSGGGGLSEIAVEQLSALLAARQKAAFASPDVESDAQESYAIERSICPQPSSMAVADAAFEIDSDAGSSVHTSTDSDVCSESGSSQGTQVAARSGEAGESCEGDEPDYGAERADTEFTEAETATASTERTLPRVPEESPATCSPFADWLSTSHEAAALASFFESQSLSPPEIAPHLLAAAREVGGEEAWPEPAADFSQRCGSDLSSAASPAHVWGGSGSCVATDKEVSLPEMSRKAKKRRKARARRAQKMAAVANSTWGTVAGTYPSHESGAVAVAGLTDEPTQRREASPIGARSGLCTSTDEDLPHLEEVPVDIPAGVLEDGDSESGLETAWITVGKRGRRLAAASTQLNPSPPPAPFLPPAPPASSLVEQYEPAQVTEPPPEPSTPPAAKPGPPERPVCRYWLRGRCRRGKKCAFPHHTSGECEPRQSKGTMHAAPADCLQGSYGDVIGEWLQELSALAESRCVPTPL